MTTALAGFPAFTKRTETLSRNDEFVNQRNCAVVD